MSSYLKLMHGIIAGGIPQVQIYPGGSKMQGE
jgi:hypothetical protein